MPFTGLDGRLVDGFEEGNNFRRSADLFRTSARGLVGVGQERGWLSGLWAGRGAMGGIWMDEQDVPEAHMRYASWGET